MSNKKEDKTTGLGTVLRGNFAPRSADDPALSSAEPAPDEALRTIEEFELAARERIGGSIAFVTRLKDKDKDVLFWDGDED